MTNIDTVRINIFLLPTDFIAKQAILVSSELIPHGLFVLGIDAHPHVTLFMTDIPKNNLDKAVSLLAHTTLSTTTLDLRAVAYRYKTDGFIDVEFQNSQPLKDFQQFVAQTMKSVRGDTLAFSEEFSTMAEDRKKNTLEWGYPEMNSCYQPHLTFSRVPTGKNSPKIATLTQHDFSFKPTSIGIALVGKHGTCTKIIAKFPLPEIK